MDLTALRVFVSVAERGGLTQAADVLHLSQPAASLQLKKLQEELGVALFERTSRGMRLTDTGHSLLPIARRALSSVADMRAVADSIRGQLRGQMKIGTIVDPEFLRLGAWMGELSSRHPGLSFDLQQGISGVTAQGVVRGQLDIGFSLALPGFSDLSPHLHVQHLTDCHYRVIAPPGWEAQVQGQDWAGLAALPWISTPQESVHSRLLAQVFESAGVTPNIAARVDVEPSMLDLVRSGVALSLARDNLALRAAHEQGVVIAQGLEVTAALGLVCRQDRRDEDMIQACFDAATAVWGKAPSAGEYP